MGGPFPLFRRLVPVALLHMPVLGLTPVGCFLVIRGHHARTVARHAPQGLRLRRGRRRRPVLRPPPGAIVPDIVLQQGRQQFAMAFISDAAHRHQHCVGLIRRARTATIRTATIRTLRTPTLRTPTLRTATHPQSRRA